jgi:hypothetical protein
VLGDTSNIGVGRRTVPKEEGQPELAVIRGMLLNRLDPLKGLSEEEPTAFIPGFRNKSDAFGNRDLRLALMDEREFHKAVMYPAAAHDIEYEFADNVDALYANVRASNRWMHEEVCFVAEKRVFLPPYIAFADPDRAVAELENPQAGRHHAPGQVRSCPWWAEQPPRGRSLADPVYDDSRSSSTSPASAWRSTSVSSITRNMERAGRRTEHRVRRLRRLPVDDVLG